MAIAKNVGSGWHSQSVRHSNARKYGKAGGNYKKFERRRSDYSLTYGQLFTMDVIGKKANGKVVYKKLGRNINGLGSEVIVKIIPKKPIKHYLLSDNGTILRKFGKNTSPYQDLKMAMRIDKKARKFGSARDLANQFAQGATRGKASNMFIDGNAIYSYGYHFPMAYRTKSGKFLVNKNKYSISTSKQQSRVRNALPVYTEVSLDTLQKAISEQI